MENRIDRIKSVDYIRLIACMFIVNSHLEHFYPEKINSLAWGGYFGNSLFFFVSGFCLTNITGSLPRWYWKRFIRVYVPYLISIPFLYFGGQLSGLGSFDILIPFKLYHFIPTILILYVFFYLAVALNKHGINYFSIICVLLIVSFLYFLVFFDIENGKILKHFSFLEMTSYFVMMLLGANANDKKPRSIYSLLGLVAASFCLYTYQHFYGMPKELGYLQLLIGMVFVYSFCNIWVFFDKQLIQNSYITLVSSITLEIYIVLCVCMDAYVSIGFPTNIVFLWFSVIGTGLFIHKIADKIIKIIPK